MELYQARREHFRRAKHVGVRQIGGGGATRSDTRKPWVRWSAATSTRPGGSDRHYGKLAKRRVLLPAKKQCQAGPTKQPYPQSLAHRNQEDLVQHTTTPRSIVAPKQQQRRAEINQKQGAWSMHGSTTVVWLKPRRMHLCPLA